MLHISIWIVIGFITGLISSIILPRLLGNRTLSILFGITGAFGGGFVVATLFDYETNERFVLSLLSALIGALIVLLLYGITIQSVLTGRGKNYQHSPRPDRAKNLQTSTQHEFQVKICPTCKRTYSDISLTFCLEDGVPLSNTVNVQAQRDPEETLFSPKGR